VESPDGITGTGRGEKIALNTLEFYQKYSTLA
jgi:hypothetical protein